VVVIRWLEPDVAEDLALASAVTDVVNRAYAHAEVGLFATKIERTDIDEVRTSISRRETAVALLEGAVVGSVRARALDGRTGWFGALGIDPTVHGRGFGGALVRFVEDDPAAAGRGAMQLEVWSPNRCIPTCRESGSGTSDAGTARRHASQSRRCTRMTRRGFSCQ
jgi:ribosomal protein S18 acetylase RimI-like enzyme